MKPFPKIHDLFIGRVLLGTVLLTWIVLLGMDGIVGGGGVLAEASDVGKGDYTFAKALLDVIYTLPRRAYTLFPTAAVIGTLGVNMLVVRYESGRGHALNSELLLADARHDDAAHATDDQAKQRVEERDERDDEHRRDDGGAAAGQQGMIDPALGALGVAHAAPVLEFSGDFDRQARAGVDPGDVIVLGRTGPDIHMIGFEADIARHRQPAGGTRRRGCRRRPRTSACRAAPAPRGPWSGRG